MNTEQIKKAFGKLEAAEKRTLIKELMQLVPREDTSEFNQLYSQTFKASAAWEIKNAAPNQPEYAVVVAIPNSNLTFTGKGTSIKLAKQNASQKALKRKDEWAK